MKNMFLAIVCLSASIAFAGKSAQEILAGCPKGDAKARHEWQFTLKVDEIKAVADYALEVSKTNLVAGKSIASLVSYSIFQHWSPVPGSELAPEYDAKFADAGFLFGYQMFVNAPKSVEKWLVTSRGGTIPSDFPAFVQYIRRGIENKDVLADRCAFLNFIAESSARRCVFYNYYILDKITKKALTNMPRSIRRRLRELGQPIVTNDGANPVQDAINELSNAFNAPRMAGLKEWVEKWFPEYKWIDVKWMTDEELAKFKDDIYYGDIDFDVANRTILKGNLGIEAYNEFVNKFNN